jgi:hypothetical protein
MRHLSASIGDSQHFLTVNLTVKIVGVEVKAIPFKELSISETFEWE